MTIIRNHLVRSYIVFFIYLVSKTKHYAKHNRIAYCILSTSELCGFRESLAGSSVSRRSCSTLAVIF